MRRRGHLSRAIHVSCQRNSAVGLETFRLRWIHGGAATRCRGRLGTVSHDSDLTALLTLGTLTPLASAQEVAQYPEFEALEKRVVQLEVRLQEAETTIEVLH